MVDSVTHAINVKEENVVLDGFGYGPAGEDSNLIFGEIDYYQFPSQYRSRKIMNNNNHTAEQLEEILFLESDVDHHIYSGLEMYDLFKDGFSSNGKGRKLNDRSPKRTSQMLGIDPLSSNAMERMERRLQSDKWDVDGLKLLPAKFEDGESLSLWMDDEDGAKPFVERAIELGVERIFVHKAIPVGPAHQKYEKIDDVETMAAKYPDIEFIIHHLGFSSVEEHAILMARFPNVWGNLSTTLTYMFISPRKFAKSLGELLRWCGPDRIMFGSDATIFHPQMLIEEFWDNFQIPKDMREEYGYPKLTDEIKRKILGLNACDLLDIDPEELRDHVKDDKWARKRREIGEKQDPWTVFEDDDWEPAVSDIGATAD